MFTRILVPTDFTAPSDAALGHARILARTFGASLHVLHVIEDQFVAGPLGAEPFGPHTPGAFRSLLDEARTELDRRVTLDDRAKRRMTAEAIVGTAARTIVDYAADNGYDLIVMGTHGRSGVAHLVMGSVAERVVRSASCPVLTVRETPFPESLPVTATWLRAMA